MKDKYPIILFEGLDGAGKTYALTHLKKYYEDRGVPVHVVDSIPFGTFLNSHDKEWFDLNILNIRYMEYMAWQVNNFYKNIKPVIGKELILIDRYLPSCFAYNDLDKDEYSAIFDSIMTILLSKFFKPDITFLVDVPNEILLERHQLTNQPIHISKLTFLDKVRKRYETFYEVFHKTGQWPNVAVLDGTKNISDLVVEMVNIINEK